MDIKKELLNDEELDRVSGGCANPDEIKYWYVGKYVRIKDTGQVGQITDVGIRNKSYEYSIRLNCNGTIVAYIAEDVEFLEGDYGIINTIEYSPDGHGVGFNF